MNIIIEHKGVKREIRGTGFNICGSREDLKRIAAEITVSELSHYGWVQVRDAVPDDPFSRPDMKPLPWAEGSK